MTIATDVGLEWLSDKAFDREADDINTMAVGTGTGSEDPVATSLSSEKYRATDADANVEFIESNATGGFDAVIRVKGGTEVPAGTEITEIAVFAGGGGSGDNVMLIVDEFSGVTVDSGRTEEFAIPVDFTR